MRVLIALGFCLLITACSGLDMKPGSKTMARRDIAPGPGLLTGSSGEFVIFRVEDAPESGTAPGKPAQADEGEKVVQ